MSLPRQLSTRELASLVEPGQSVYVAGGLLPPGAFVESLQADPERTAGVEFTSTIVAGFFNPFDFDRLHPTSTLTSPLAHPAYTAAQKSGRFRTLPVSFAGYLRYLAGRSFDLGVVQVAPPDAQGRYSLGPNVEFLPAAMARCRRVVAVVNPMLPRIDYSTFIDGDRIDAVCEAESPLPSYATQADEVTDAIGRSIAGFIDDGSTIQMGLGKVPGAIARGLLHHRRLKIHSGMVSDGLMELANAGVLDGAAPHMMCVAAGSEALYSWLPTATDHGLHLVGCDQTHTPAALARLDRFIAINSALEVDLFGQCNLEHQAGRAISGAGAAPDFAAAAKNSTGGLSIVALNATYARGTKSRIVCTLGPGAVASLSRVQVDLVVTEFGAADLRQASVGERARALIGIAAPQFRPALEEQWAILERSL